MKLRTYIAGKVSPNSVFGTHDWREGFCVELSKLSGFQILNLDPAKSSENFDLDENNSKLIFGRDCYMIKNADLVIVNLTDDISVGGSQEMLIAKYYKKPLLAIAKHGGKFNKAEKEIRGKIYQSWIHPFVKVPCDAVVDDMEDAANFIKEWFTNPARKPKGISVLDETCQYYEKEHLPSDALLHF